MDRISPSLLLGSAVERTQLAKTRKEEIVSDYTFASEIVV